MVHGKFRPRHPIPLRPASYRTKRSHCHAAGALACARRRCQYCITTCRVIVRITGKYNIVNKTVSTRDIDKYFFLNKVINRWNLLDQ